VELADAIGRRRMTRSFVAEPVATDVLDNLLEVALRAPSAGFSQGVDLVVLEGEPARARFWELATDASWRGGGERSEGLRNAPVVVVPVADPAAYEQRYGEPDKRGSLLGGLSASEWPVPFWLVDASFVVMQLLLAATDAGLGALFFQLHAPADTVLEGLGVPAGRVTFGAVAIGHPAPDDKAGSPGSRARRAVQDVVHRDRW
jgi:nitroreductase